ncbi:hypothetical protein PIROE2DRAFT_9628 [Piromyces sp. E2]|nr:hypothetical protein PIROE2DRAFT_9628 [Piromyces sp. E2]|eukprot:OUM63765.1 hypothetical protein PIROE2DRAFT_9628 [Piromyces sp. E2]
MSKNDQSGSNFQFGFDSFTHIMSGVHTGASKVFGLASTVYSGASGVCDALKGNYKEAFTTVIGSVGSYYYGAAGSEIGMVIGSVFGPLGAAAGYIIGGIAGIYFGSYVGKMIVDSASPVFSYIFGVNSIKASGLKGPGDTGGVEFVSPRIISEFKNNYCFNDKLYISFKKYSSKTEQEILNLLNNNFLINGAKFDTIDQVFSTILNELAIGYLADKKLPFISLNFNKEGLLYPIMDEYYKHTLVGCVITMLDYYLKCYVNGGFFKEDFVYAWQKTKNTNKFDLEKNFLNIKMYLLSIYKDKNKIFYSSLNDIKSTNFEEKQIFLSAFRIVGKMDNKIKYHKDLLLPQCYYDVEYDIDISPVFKADATFDPEKQNIINDNEKAHKLMAFLVKLYMNDVPYFKPYFELLNIITFFTMNELFNIFSESQKKTLNVLCSVQFLELEDELNSMETNHKLIEKGITRYMNEKIKKLLVENGENANIVDITRDNDLGIPLISHQHLNTLINKNNYKNINNSFDLKKLLSCKTLRELNGQVFKLLETYKIVMEKENKRIVKEYNKKVKKFRKTHEKEKKEEINQLKNSGDWTYDKEEKLNKEFLKKYNDEMNTFDSTLKKDLELTELTKLEKDLKNAKNQLRIALDYSVLNNLNRLLLSMLKIQYPLTLQSLDFDSSSEATSKIEIRGGCLVKLNINLILAEHEIQKDLYNKIINNKNDDYYCIKSKLINTPVHGESLNELVKSNYDSNKNQLTHSVLVKKQTIVKDNCGFSYGHYKSFIGDYQSMMPTNLNSVSHSGIRPEMVAVTLGNVRMVSELLKLNYSNFSSPSYNAITPILMAILNQDEKMINFLLDYPHKIGDINYTNELKKTYLHYACELNMPTITKRILQLNGTLNSRDRKNGNSPLHLICQNSNIETLNSIIDNALPYIDIQRLDGKTLLHLSSYSSILCTKLLLRNKANPFIIDGYGNDCYYLAVHSGRFDCYQQLPENKKYSKKLDEQLNNAFSLSHTNHSTYDKVEYLKELFKEERYKEIEKVISSMKETLPYKDSHVCFELIHCCCKGRNKESIKYLSQLVDFKKYPLMPFIGKYGLKDWIKEAIGYGCDLYESNKSIDNGATIFDWCIESNDDKMLSCIFNFIENVDERLNSTLSRVICKAAVQERIYVLSNLQMILEFPKFKTVQLSIHSLCQNPNITLGTFNLSVKAFKHIDLSTIDLNDAIKYCRPSVFREMLKLKPNLSPEIWKSLEKEGKSREDNLFVLSEFYPITFDKVQYSKTLHKISDLLTEDGIIIETLMQKKLTFLLKQINIGLPEFTDEKIFLPHYICKTNSFWAMKCLPASFADYFFIKDDHQRYAFDYILPSYDIEDHLALIFDYFDSLPISQERKANYILLCLDHMISVFNEIPFRKNVEIDLNKLLEKYNYIYDYSNINNENIFFILSKKKININHQNVEGNTLLMNVIKNKNLIQCQEIINKYPINFGICNNEGDSYLHLLYKEDILKGDYNDKLKVLYELTLKIISKKPSNILLQNREGLTPYLLASRIGCNTGLFLMSLFYPPMIIEKYSINTSALHEACYFNKINTVRYLIEYLNYNVNQQIIQSNHDSADTYFNTYSTPLHCAAKSSSLAIFKLLLYYGAIPFIKDSRDADAITTAIEYGNKEMLTYIFKSPFMMKNNYSNSHLIAMVKNKNAEKCVKCYIISNSIHDFSIISDENMNNLLMLSCLYDNPGMVNWFIYSDIDVKSQNKNGNNVLHLCCHSRSMACACELLSILKKKCIQELLLTKNNDGDTPLHIASEYGLFSHVALFLSCTDKDNKDYLSKNNDNLSPIQKSIKFNKFDITILFMEFYGLTIDDIKVLRISTISFELDKFIVYYHENGSLIDKVKYRYNNMVKNRPLKTIEEIIPKMVDEEDDKKFKEALNTIKNKDYHDYKTYDRYHALLSKIYMPDNFNEKIFTQYQSLIGNLNILFIFKMWHDYKKDNYIDYFMMILSEIEDSNKNSMEMFEIFLNYILIKVDIAMDDTKIILNELHKLVLFCNAYPNSQYFVQVVHSVLISYLESKIEINILNVISIIKNFRRLIENEDPIVMLENIKSIQYNISPYQFIKNLLKICGKREQMKLVQIKYANFIPPLLNEEIDELIQMDYPILHKSIYSTLPLDRFIKTILTMKDISPTSLDISLKCDQYIRNSQRLNINEKIIVFDFLLKLIKKTSVLSEELFSFAKSAENYIEKTGDVKTIEKLIYYPKSINDVIVNINKLNKIPEFNFNQYHDKLEELLSRIEFYDTASLKEIAHHFNRYYIEYSTNKNFGEFGRQLGKEFRDSPTIINMARLLAFVTRGFEEVMNFTPYLIQILAISSFLLHYTKGSKNHGRIAQIKTGEGKSMIIAILGLCNALMGYFVDVITSTHYLAERDQIKFKKLFSLFGISSCAITKQNPLKEDYNGIILYGTNTDFEFTLLREGIFIQNKNWTQPLGKKQLVKREYHVSIVDECDNLFLDTALNSARIAYTANYHYNWVYYPIFNYVKKTAHPNIYEMRQLLNTFENGIHQKELSQINDEILQKWLNGAKIALEKTINKDYIIGFNERFQKREIQIISSDTGIGRVQYGCRWCDSIHEFVEVKEGLIPEEESSIIGSISHPTFFQNYQTIFGLTGTVGEEIEKNEIRKLYNIDLYHLPRNFKERLVIEKPEIFKSKTQKYQKIEKEEYILEKAGNIGSILISTNAAGRGTDIILSKEALAVGGLYVILGFFPQNSRIEYQGIGRAGRQGQLGKAKIIFSEDETFIQNELAKSSTLSPPCYENDKIKYYYDIRNAYIERESKKRIQHTELERVYYRTLCNFFEFKRFLLELFEKYEIKTIMRSELEPYYKFLLSQIDQLWANFYSEKVSKRNFLLTDNAEKLFTSFLEYFLKNIKLKQSQDPYYKDFNYNIFIQIIENIKNDQKSQQS